MKHQICYLNLSPREKPCHDPTPKGAFRLQPTQTSPSFFLPKLQIVIPRKETHTPAPSLSWTGCHLLLTADGCLIKSPTRVPCYISLSVYHFACIPLPFPIHLQSVVLCFFPVFFLKKIIGILYITYVHLGCVNK